MHERDYTRVLLIPESSLGGLSSFAENTRIGLGMHIGI
jgi:hypothetical protein